MASGITLQTIVELSGWWGPSSVLVAHDSIISKIKQTTTKKLLEHKLISQNDLTSDLRNVTPHISITDGKTHPRCQKAYDKINGKQLTLNENSLRVNKNYLDIAIGHSGRKYCHFTLCYSRGVGSNVSLIKSLFRETLAEVNSKQQPNQKDESSTLCVICVTRPYNIVFNCGHLCVCEECSNSNISDCPMCRAPITKKDKIFCA